MQPGSYPCSRHSSQKFLLTVLPENNVQFSLTISAENDEVQNRTYYGIMKAEGRVITLEWKSCDVSFPQSETPDEEKKNVERMIRVSKCGGMLTPDNDGLLITGALPHEAQGQSHGGYRFILKKE